jgi:hypothetical protein
MVTMRRGDHGQHAAILVFDFDLNPTRHLPEKCQSEELLYLYLYSA